MENNTTNITPPQTLPQLRTTAVDLNGLMNVLGKHLYSTPIVAVRELVQNAHDSISRRRIEDRSFESAPKIQVLGDLAQNVLRIIDTGAGLTEHEIHQYLATVGVGYTRVLREKTESENLIGMFGLGFLSAFVLASEVTVTTTSYQTPNETWQYQSSTGEQYTVQPVTNRAIGTEVTLKLRLEHSELAGEGLLSEVLSRYCALLSEPIFIGQADTAINADTPPWRLDASNDVAIHPVAQRRQWLEFAKRFERYFEPLCVMPLLATETSDARGLLWIQDGATYGTSDNRNLSVFVRGMLLDDDARDLLPIWAGFVSGVIESNRLTPTASREDLQRDDYYDAVQEALIESLVTGLGDVAKTQPEAWRRVLMRHNESLLGAALCDERLFGLLADSVRIPSSQGELAAKNLLNQGKIYVTLGTEGGFEEMLFRSMGIAVAHGDRYAVVPFLRRWVSTRGGQLIELGTEQGNRQLFRAGQVESETKLWLQEHLADHETVILAHFEPKHLPMVLVPDREAELKRRLANDEADKRISMTALRLARSTVAQADENIRAHLYINLENPAIVALLKTLPIVPEKAQHAATTLRALKIILSQNNHKQANEQDNLLNQALQTMNQVVIDML